MQDLKGKRGIIQAVLTGSLSILLCVSVYSTVYFAVKSGAQEARIELLKQDLYGSLREYNRTLETRISRQEDTLNSYQFTSDKKFRLVEERIDIISSRNSLNNRNNISINNANSVEK